MQGSISVEQGQGTDAAGVGILNRWWRQVSTGGRREGACSKCCDHYCAPSNTAPAMLSKYHIKTCEIKKQTSRRLFTCVTRGKNTARTSGLNGAHHMGDRRMSERGQVGHQSTGSAEPMSDCSRKSFTLRSKQWGAEPGGEAGTMGLDGVEFEEGFYRFSSIMTEANCWLTAFWPQLGLALPDLLNTYYCCPLYWTMRVQR